MSEQQEEQLWSDLIAEDTSEPEIGTEEPAVEEPPADQESPQPEPEQELEKEKEEEKVQEAPPAPKPELTPEQVKELRAKFEETLASKFTFSEEEALALQTEPEKVLPKLAARLYADVLEDVGRMISSSVPSLVQEYAVSAEREMRAKAEFFGEWPELRDYEQQVLMVGEMFRKMNPTASPKEAIKRIGEITMATLGLQRKPKEPAAPKPQAFKPAGAGRIQTPEPEPNIWEQIFED